MGAGSAGKYLGLPIRCQLTLRVTRRQMMAQVGAGQASTQLTARHRVRARQLDSAGEFVASCAES
eukprot:9113237-Pyramimonas_sp.AAC.1